MMTKIFPRSFRRPALYGLPALLLAASGLVYAAIGAGVPARQWITPNGPAVGTRPGTASLSFNGAAGDKVSLLTQPAMGLAGQCFAVTITPPGGGSPLYASRQCGPWDFSDALALPVSGTYAILVESPAPATLGLYGVPADAAGSLSGNGSSASLAITTPGQNAVAMFGGNAGARVSVLTQLDSALVPRCVKVTVAAPDGTPVYEQNQCGPANLSESLGLAGGTYKVLLDPAGPSTGVATLTLLNIPDDPSLPPGAARYSLNIAAPGQTVQQSFPGVGASRVNVLSEKDNELKRACNTLVVAAPDGRTQLLNQNQCGQSLFTGPLSLPATGSYSVVFQSSGGATGNETLTLFSVPPDATGALAPGGSGLQLTTVIPGQGMKATFAGQLGRSATFFVAADASLSSQCFRVTAYNPDGSTLGDDTSCGMTYQSAARRLAQTGTYTVAVTSTGMATGTATIGVRGQ